jgi:peptidoglycan-associated lipoprotein
MRLIKVMLPIGALCLLSGCATRSYVDESIARVDTRQAEQDQQLQELSATSSQALERANDAGVLARGKFMYDVVLTDESTTFRSAETELGDNVRRRLDELALQLKNDNQNVYLEIQGFTDATGPEDYNERLGQQRAESVRRYLHEQGVPLNRMATISYGENNPAAPNETPDGRASNRRVAIVVLN